MEESVGILRFKAKIQNSLRPREIMGVVQVEKGHEGTQQKSQLLDVGGTWNTSFMRNKEG